MFLKQPHKTERYIAQTPQTHREADDVFTALPRWERFCHWMMERSRRKQPREKVEGLKSRGQPCGLVVDLAQFALVAWVCGVGSIHVVGVLVATELSLLLGPLRRQSKEFHVCILTRSYTHIYNYFYV